MTMGSLAESSGSRESSHHLDEVDPYAQSLQIQMISNIADATAAKSCCSVIPIKTTATSSQIHR